MKKSGKFKLSLLGSIGVSLLAVSTAAVSTFAWFRAEADVQVSAASSDPVSITVNAPDPEVISITTKLYAYKQNGAAGYTTPLSNVAFNSTNFEEITSLSGTITGLHPARRKTFCLEVTSESTITSLTMKINTLTDSAKATDTFKRYILTSVTQDPSESSFVKMSSAIKFNGICTDSASYTEPNSGDQTLEASTTSLSNSAAMNANTIYVFYTLKFIDDETTRFIEYEKIDSNSFQRLYDSPHTVIDTQTHEVIDTKNRYFKQDANGDSSCFEGLSFKINELQLDL